MDDSNSSPDARQNPGIIVGCLLARKSACVRVCVCVWLGMCRVLPLELAVEVDEYNERMGLAGAAENIGKEYMPPAMRPFTNPDLSPDAGAQPCTRPRDQALAPRVWPGGRAQGAPLCSLPRAKSRKQPALRMVGEVLDVDHNSNKFH